MDWESLRELWERLAAAARDAAETAPHGSIYHVEAAKFLAMCQCLEEHSRDVVPAADEQEAASPQDAAEAGAGAGEAAPAAASPPEDAEASPEAPKPRGRRR
jgi:hypothetical protein